MNSRMIKVAAIAAGMLVCGAVFFCSRQSEIQLETVTGSGMLPEEDTETVIIPEAAGNIGSRSAAATDTVSGDQEPAGQIMNDGLWFDAPQSETAAAETEAVIFVHVCGSVNEPDVYMLPLGSRVADAVRAAGGFSPEASQDYINLAEKLTDGMRIYVPDTAESSEAAEESGRANILGISGGEAAMQPEGAESRMEEAADQLIDINTASAEELMQLKGIGSSRAADIIDYREKNGPFSTIEDIMKVPGIKQASFDKIKMNIKAE